MPGYAIGHSRKWGPDAVNTHSEEAALLSTVEEALAQLKAAFERNEEKRKATFELSSFYSDAINSTTALLKDMKCKADKAD